MKATRIVLLIVVALAMCGCFHFENIRIPDPPDVNIDVNDGEGGSAIDIDVGGQASANSLGAEKGVLFYAYDAMAYAEQEQQVVVRLVSARTFEGLAGATIAFAKDGRRIADATTDANGFAGLTVKPRRPGDYTFTATIVAIPASLADEVLDVAPTQVMLIARDVEDKFLIVRVDDVLVRPSLADLLVGKPVQPAPDASDVLSRLAENEDCTVIYVTDRSEQMNGRLKYWLADNMFPAGPVLTMAASGRSSSDLTDLQRAYPELAIGIAASASATRSFLDIGMTAFMIPRYQADPDDMRDLAEDIDEMPDTQHLSVVNSWREIEAAMLHGVRYTAETYADRLERLADEIEDQQERDRRDDD